MTISCQLDKISTPAYVLDRQKIRANLAVAARIKAATGCKILLATKAFACTALFNEFAKVLDGTTASGLYEARLGYEHFGGEVHAYSPAYTDAELEALLPICDHLYFNSVGQLSRYLSHWERSQSAGEVRSDAGEGHGSVTGVRVLGCSDEPPNTSTAQHPNTPSHPLPSQATPSPTSPRGRGVKLGLRLNPQLSLVKNSSLYDPSAPNSRFGVKKEALRTNILGRIDILHVHNLCENMAADSVALIDHLMATVPKALDAVEAVNLGGGHYFTHPNYDVDALIPAINRLQEAHNVQVILEPGGALVYDAGYLVASVVDVLDELSVVSGQSSALDEGYLSHRERACPGLVPGSQPVRHSLGGGGSPSVATNDAGEGHGSVEGVRVLECSDDPANTSTPQHPNTPSHPLPSQATPSPTSPSGRGSIAILDTSATCHMPDVLEVPYTPEVVGAESFLLKGGGSQWEQAPFTYQLTGKTCLTGDIIGTYHFPQPLAPGDKVIFKDMAQYSMVKNTTFNGMPLPDIGVLEEDGSYRLLKRFGYEDFRERLA
jgi:diaminopimelate decarboxylase